MVSPDLLHGIHGRLLPVSTQCCSEHAANGNDAHRFSASVDSQTEPNETDVATVFSNLANITYSLYKDSFQAMHEKNVKDVKCKEVIKKS